PIADGETLDTHCFQRALNHLATRGGGTLSVPPGRYHLGTLTLGSNINLHLEAGATLLASSRVEDYQQQLAQSQAELSQHVLLYAV
ncbi:glycoside hydrolase family 28 protein, partial [Klebsiella pneumoniae]|nr:glycoside hydrolase family 28 protein [Klebsiella pneumoniae]